MVDSNPIKPTSEDAPDRTIYECTGCGTVTRDRVAQMALYKRAGALSCCPERNMVPVQPAERALVMPDPKPVPVYQVAPLAAESAIGWNNALREVARLNATHSAQADQQPVSFRKARCISMRPGMGEVTLYVDCGVPSFMDPGCAVYVSDVAPIAQNEQLPVAWGLPDKDKDAPRPFLLLVHSLSQVAHPEGMVPLFAAPIAQPAPPCNHRFMYFGDQKKRRCADCCVVEGNEQAAQKEVQHAR